MKFVRYHTELPNRHDQPGSALLALLLAIVIMMALYFIDIKMIFRPTGKSGRSGEVLPWNEEERIVAKDKAIELPKPPKPALDRFESFATKVMREGQERGTLDIRVFEDGRVAGSWNCEFTQDNREATFQADFKGNIDIDKTYQNETEKEPSWLYFITKGKYIETIYNTKTTQGGVNGGTVYVTGWLKPNGNASGTLTITTDKKWSGAYEWSTESMTAKTQAGQ